jgi:hypothetical protein
LLPAVPPAEANPVELGTPADLVLSEAGALHPVTTRCADAAGRNGDAGAAGLARNAVLLAGARNTDRAALAIGYAGTGRTILIDTDRLWTALNPTKLDAHTRLYVDMVTWGLESTAAPVREGQQVLRTDLRRAQAGAPLQVWLQPAGDEEVEAVTADGVAALSGPEEGSAAVGLTRYVFDGLLDTDTSFRIKGREDTRTPPVILIGDEPELDHVALFPDELRQLSADTDGEFASFIDIERSLSALAPRERVEKRERIWRLWDLGSVFALIVICLTAEWVWRKLVGLV